MEKYILIFTLFFGFMQPGIKINPAIGTSMASSQKVSTPEAPREVLDRTISTAEYQFALTIFQREFPPRDQVFISNEYGLNNSYFVRPTINGNVRINMGNLYNQLLSNTTNKSIFAHELTHAWQLGHYGKTWYLAQAFDNQVLTGNAYNYTCVSTKTLGDYNAEQMGEVVKEHVLGKPCATSIVTKTLFSTTWKLLIGSDAKDVAVDENGTYYFVNNGSGLIYKYSVDDWKKLVGTDGSSIAANGGKLCMINTAGKIYQWVNSAWKQLPGSDGRDIAVNSDGTIWMTNTAGKIYKYNGTAWTQTTGSDAATISAGNGQVWMVNNAGKIYQYTGAGWTQKAGSSGRDVTVSNDGVVWLTNTEGQVFKWNSSNGSWILFDGSDCSRIAAGKGKLIMANKTGRLFYRTY